MPRVYDEFDDGDTRLDPAALAGSFPASRPHRGGTVLMAAALAPTLQGPAARFVAANTPSRVQIRVSPPAPRVSHSEPTSTEWAVAVAAGLLAAVVIGVVAALV